MVAETPTLRDRNLPTLNQLRGLHAPMGLGWRRALAAPADLPHVELRIGTTPLAARSRAEVCPDELPGGAPLVLTGIHRCSPTVLEVVRDLTQDPPPGREVVLCSTLPLPSVLSAAVRRLEEVRPVTAGEFGDDPATATDRQGWIRCGGWPEAGCWNGAWRPSQALEDFAEDLRRMLPGATEVVLLTGVSERGLPPEVIAELIGASLERALSTVGTMEEMGALRWEGPLVRPSVPLLVDAVASTDSEMRAAAVEVARNPLARRLGLAALPALSAGLELDEELFGAACDALSRAEAELQTARWSALSAAMVAHPDPRAREIGGASADRLATVRGEPVVDPVEPLGEGGPPVRELYRRLLFLDGLSYDSASLGPHHPPAVFPLDPRGRRYSDPIVGGVVAGLRGEERAVAEALQEIDAWRNHTTVPNWIIALFSGRQDRLLEIELSDPGNPYLAVLVAIRHAVEGRFSSASSRLHALLGEDWRRAAPLFRYLGLYVAAGTDVELARQLLAHTRFPRPGQIGTLAADYVRARAESVTGDTQRARARVLEVWEAGVTSGFTRPLVVFSGEILAILAEGGSLAPVAEAEPDGDLAPIVGLASALEGEKLDGDDVLDRVAALPSTYSRSHAQVLVGRRALELGDLELARSMLVSAEAAFHALGAPVDAGRARRILRHVDPSLDRGAHVEFAADATGPVTGRERQVLELVGKGLTNKEIAAALYLSTSTVKRHVTALLRHFEATSRRQLMSLADEVLSGR
jgi:DNA-binding CsgD family transcriptional regulator